ncbi:hypothetical protein BOH72_26315 [Mycobacterium sp. WY10]|nr:hypothetical protein BOH72_26315 [Mycobacterium sp. WY10]
MQGRASGLNGILRSMHHDKSSRAENTRKAIGVMTAYFAEDQGTALASQMATEYANEPHGTERLIDGFVHLSSRLIQMFEVAGLPRSQVLQMVAEAVNETEIGETEGDGGGPSAH